MIKSGCMMFRLYKRTGQLTSETRSLRSLLRLRWWSIPLLSKAMYTVQTKLARAAMEARRSLATSIRSRICFAWTHFVGAGVNVNFTSLLWHSGLYDFCQASSEVQWNLWYHNNPFTSHQTQEAKNNWVMCVRQENLWICTLVCTASVLMNKIQENVQLGSFN